MVGLLSVWVEAEVEYVATGNLRTGQTQYDASSRQRPLHVSDVAVDALSTERMQEGRDLGVAARARVYTQLVGYAVRDLITPLISVGSG